MGFFNGVSQADTTSVSTSTPYFLPGVYKVKITECKAFNNRNGVPFFVVNAEILESSNDELAVGTVCGQVIKLNQDMGPINVKRFVAAANGIDPNSEEANAAVTPEVCDLVVSSEQPLVGLELGLQCHMTKTASGGDFTVHAWQKVETT